MHKIVFTFILLLSISATYTQAQPLVFCGSEENDLYQLLQQEGMEVLRFDSPEEAIKQAGIGAGIIISTRKFHYRKTPFDEIQYQLVKKNI